MHISRRLVVAALPLVLALAAVNAGCSSKKKESPPEGAAPVALSGTWRAVGEEAPSLDGAKAERSWEVLYTFGPNGYRMEGYPVKPQEGKVEVLSREGQTFRLRLGPDNREVELTLADDGQSFMMGGFLYSKTEPAAAP